MAAFRICFIGWKSLPEFQAEGPCFSVFPKEEGHRKRSINVPLTPPDIKTLKYTMGLQESEGVEQFKNVVIRYAIKRIEQGLREDRFPNSPNTTTDNLFITQDEHPALRQMLQEKTCEYRIKERRDLLCIATGPADRTALNHREFQLVAPTTHALCRECALPDTDYLCSHFAHPLV